MIPPVVMHVLTTMALLCNLSLAPVLPEPEPWEPAPADVAYVSRTIWGETRGCPYDEQWAQGCCVVNRVDDPRWGDTIEAVVLQPNQFQGYSPNNPEEPFHDMAREILIAWHNGDTGVPKDMCFCEGDGKHQTFRTTWLKTEETRYWPSDFQGNSRNYEGEEP